MIEDDPRDHLVTSWTRSGPLGQQGVHEDHLVPSGPDGPSRDQSVLRDRAAEPRMWCVMRCDLPELSWPKALGQAGHAFVMSLAACFEYAPERALAYMRHPSQGKIILRAKSLDDLLKVQAKANEAGIPCALVTDEGRTCLDAGTTTCLGIGPSTLEAAGGVIKRLQVLKESDFPERHRSTSA